MAGITALNNIVRRQAAFGGIMGRDGRRQYGGGSDMGQVPDSDGNVGPGTGGYQGGPLGGYGDAERDGPTDQNPYDKGKDKFKEIKEEQKDLYEKQFYDKGQVPPLGSRPISFGTKINQINKQKRLKYINYLQKEINKKLQKGLMDSSIPGVDVMTMEEMIGLAPSVKDLVEKGFYSKDGKFAKGAIPDFNTINMPGTLGVVQDIFEGPVTSDKLNQLNTQLSTLEGLKTTAGLESDAAKFNTLMETYQPNRFKLLNSPTGGGGDNGGSQQYIPYLPPEEDVADETTFDYRFGTGQKVGRDVTLGYAANGGRITRAGGGIMNAIPRQGYFLGKIVKGVGKAIGSVADAAGKVLKSDAGKLALLAGGAYLAGGYLPGGGGITGGFSNFSNLGKNLLLKDRALGFTKGNYSLGKILGLSAALPFIPGLNKVPENEDIGMGTRGGRLIDPITGEEGTPQSMRDNIELAKQEAAGDPIKLAQLNQKYNNMLFSNLPYENYGTYANGGRIARAEGGLMDLGGMEKDYRAEGGFVPIGKQEKADDVPARLSVNEFVFTADAVRNAGGGDIDKGAEVMENMMKNLENGGRVSEESQGNTGAQEMFSVSERIGEVI